MKVLFYTLCILCISIPSFGQKKVTVYKPTANKEYVKMSQLENKVVSLCFKDSRVIPPKSKIKCTFKDIVDAITESLDLSYGNSFVKCCKVHIYIAYDLRHDWLFCKQHSSSTTERFCIDCMEWNKG